MQTRLLRVFIAFSLLLVARSGKILAADPTPLELYKQMQTFKLGESSAKVQDFVFDKELLHMTLTGDLYFSEMTGGAVYGAVFIGQGKFRAEAQNPTEVESLKRFFSDATAVESTFTKAVFRFTDDTYKKLSVGATTAMPPLEAQKLASGLDEHLLHENGLNLTARLVQSIYNKDNPGVFFAEFDGGTRGRFSALTDHQGRIPSDVFDINGGEKGLIFKYEGIRYGTDVWMTFYSQADIARKSVAYSDAFDLVSVASYKMDIDVRDPGNWLRMSIGMQMTAKTDNVAVIPLQLNQGLAEFDNERKNKGIHILSAALADGRPVGVIQDEWETGASLVLPTALSKGQSITVNLKLEGKDSLASWGAQFHYLRSTTSWYPRHGYLARSAFQITYHHNKKNRVASVGQRVREGADQGDDWTTEWVLNDPVALVTFVVGPFERHAENSKVGNTEIPIEYYSPPGSIQAVKEDFILAEIGNAARFFDNIFGSYPYSRLAGAFFPTNYGQGFPTLLLLPVKGTADRAEFKFLAHETAHQWWGHVVGWRSYRDQWLSEGFADYSGLMYTRTRSGAKDQMELLKVIRRELLLNPPTVTGTSKLKLHETGPLILGNRLHSTKSGGARELIYAKGALVLRMLHFLLTDMERNDDSRFYAMMKDFVNRHRAGVATSESFMQVAGEHFAKSPIGMKYGVQDLNWFLSQWVYQTSLPSYQLDYKIEGSAGAFVLKGTVTQTNAPDSWFMPLPIQVDFSGGRSARTTVSARGPKTPFEIKLPEKPSSVKLDPDLWVLSEKTTEKGS
jgi:hypothetical protein